MLAGSGLVPSDVQMGWLALHNKAGGRLGGASRFESHLDDMPTAGWGSVELCLFTLGYILDGRFVLAASCTHIMWVAAWLYHYHLCLGWPRLARTHCVSLLTTACLY
jgi:hypothetical protein